MLFALAVALAQATYFAPPTLWASGFAAPPRIPLCGDVDGDGLADLVCVYPPGDSIIDVSLNQQGQKAGVPFQGLTGWGKDCQAAAIGDLDEKRGADVAGIFAGDTIRLAHGFQNGRFKDEPDWAKLPRKIVKPTLAVRGGSLLVQSKADRGGFEIDIATRRITPVRSPLAIPLDAKQLGLPTSKLPASPSVLIEADMDGDGDMDFVEYRYGVEKHTGLDVLIYRRISPGETDSDADGLTNEQEQALGTDPFNPDTDNDGLLDGWETGTFRDLDLKALGCNPLRIDLICLISRFAGLDEASVKKEMGRVARTYSELNVANPDGSKGWAFHPIYLDPVADADQKNPWWTNRDKFRPSKWRGIVHWMQIGPGGGGQADEMGDGGGCSINALWAVFLHEFGHQIGMNHEGFWAPGLCPIYTSLMNYAYSYSYEDDGNKIHYSDGGLKDLVLDENRLDETLPFPYEKVKFLEMGPYRFHLKPNGKTTLIDWNWNGIFGEKNIRADINYSYSTNAGRRDEIGKIMTSPWLFTHLGHAWTVYGTHNFPGDPKTDPSVAPEKPGDLWLRELDKPFKWKEPTKLGEGLVGDPVAASKDGSIYVACAFGTSHSGGQAPVGPGVALFRLKPGGKRDAGILLTPDVAQVPSIGIYKNRLYVFLWSPASGEVTYRTLDSGLDVSREKRLLRRSTVPVGMAVDTLRDQIIIGAAEDQDKARPSRWQIRRCVESSGHIIEKSVEWIEGEPGGSRGYGRCTVLFDGSKPAGPDGRIYFYGRGLTSKENPWSCTYVAHQIADKSMHGGWLVKRFYDEWTQTRSAPAAAWFGNDVIWAYRWVDGGQGERDNLFHVGYRALGIDEAPMGDHDDISFFRDIGIRHSILYMNSQ